MSKKARNATLIGVAAGLIAAPFVYRIIHKYRQNKQSEGGERHNQPEGKHILSAYRSGGKKHQRHAHHNGNGGE